MLYIAILLFVLLIYCTLSTSHISARITDFTGTDDVHKGGFTVRYNETDYFRFFKRLGRVSYVHMHLLEKIYVGIVCVLRDIPGVGKVWFLADYRVRRKHRNKGLAKLFLLFTYFYLRLFSGKFYGLVMGDVKRVGYLSYLQDYIKWTKVHFYTFSKAELPQHLERLKTVSSRFDNVDFVNASEIGKELLVDGKVMNLFHIVPSASRRRKVSDIPNDATIMVMLLDVEKEMMNVKQWASGHIVHNGFSEGETFTWLSSADV